MPATLNRRTFAAALLGAAGTFASPARANGLSGMLWEYHLEYIRLLDERRRKQFEAIQTPEDVKALRQRVRQALAEMWGPFPAEKNPLNVQTTGQIARGPIVIEKIVFESRPQFHVTANLYRSADAEGRLPAVIVPCGHAAEGKAAETYQRFALLLARHGLIALVYDPVSQGERQQLADPATREPVGGSGTKEHRFLGHQCYLVGLNLMNYRAWDAHRAIDYLETRPDVDPARIGMGGNSGGGMETLQYAAFDPRVQAAFPSCAVATFRAKTEALRVADPEQILFGTLRRGIDHPELLAAFAPRPLVIGSAIHDYIPIDAARRTFRDVARIYGIMGASGHIKHAESDAGHGLNGELREAGADWLSRWLSRTSRAVREDGSIPPATVDELRCTPTGQVLSAYGGKSVSDLNREHAARVAAVREPPLHPAHFGLFQNDVRAHVKRVTNVGSFRPELGIYILDHRFDADPFVRGVAFVVSDAGQDDPELRRNVIDAILSARWAVITLDLRGWGGSLPASSRPVGFDWEDFFAYRALEIGKPLLGQRMKDLLAVAPARTRHRKWTLVGVGAAAAVAAHATILDDRVERLVTVDGLLSYRNLLDNPVNARPASDYLPGVLGAYDIRDLYGAAAPRPVLAINPRDAHGSIVPSVRAWEEYDWVAQVYEGDNAAGGFEMKTGLEPAEVRRELTQWFS